MQANIGIVELGIYLPFLIALVYVNLDIDGKMNNGPTIEAAEPSHHKSRLKESD